MADEQLNTDIFADLAKVHAMDIEYYHHDCSTVMRALIDDRNVKTSKCSTCGMLVLSTLSTSQVRKERNASSK